MANSLPSPRRKLSIEEDQFFLGIDTLFVTPADKEGYQYINVVRLLPSRLTALYPSKDLTAESMALALFQFFITYGISDVLISDPDSNITAEVVELLLTWFGIRLRLSIVNRH